MYAQVRPLAHLDDLVTKTNGCYTVKQTVYLGKQETPLAERGSGFGEEEFSELQQAYDTNKLYFWVP